MTKTIQLTLLALVIFGAANIQSAESQEEASPTQQLYAAIDELNVKAVQEILRAHPEEADKISCTNEIKFPIKHNFKFPFRGKYTSPLFFVLSFYTTERYFFDQEMHKLNQITTALLNAEANPNLFAPFTDEELRQHLSIRRAAKSPLTKAVHLLDSEQYNSIEFLKTILAHSATCPSSRINQPDGEGKSALSRAAELVAEYAPYETPQETAFKQFRGLKAIRLLLSAGAGDQDALNFLNTKNINASVNTNLIWEKLFFIQSLPFIGAPPYHFSNSHQAAKKQGITAAQEMLQAANDIRLNTKTSDKQKQAALKTALKKINNKLVQETDLADKKDSTASMIATGIKFAGIVGLLTTAHKIASKYGVYTRIATTAKALAQRFAVAAVVAA